MWVRFLLSLHLVKTFKTTKSNIFNKSHVNRLPFSNYSFYFLKYSNISKKRFTSFYILNLFFNKRLDYYRFKTSQSRLQPFILNYNIYYNKVNYTKLVKTSNQKLVSIKSIKKHSQLHSESRYDLL